MRTATSSVLRAPAGLRKPPLSDTRWLAVVKKDFDGRIAGGLRHSKYGAHVVSVGAGLPHNDTYDVAKAIYRGTNFILHHARYPKPKGFGGWLDTFGNLRATSRKIQEANSRLSQMFNYGSTDSLPIVRESFAALSQRDWGYKFSPDNVFPASGGTTSLIDSLVKSFENIHGEFAVFVSRPAYTGTVARLAQAKNIRVYSIALDDEGMIPAVLVKQVARARKDGRQPAFVIDVPLGHNPMGISYSEARIHEIYAVIVNDPDLFFVEDDPYGSFQYGDGIRRPPVTFTGIDTENRVVLMRTGSKTDIPTFRSAFMHSQVRYQLPNGDIVTLKDMMMSAGGMAYLVPNNLSLMMTVAQWYESDLETMGSLWPEAERRTIRYAANRNALLDSLAVNFDDLRGDLVSWNEPTSGFFLRFKMNRRPINPQSGQVMTSREIVEWLIENEFLITTPMSGFYPADAREEQVDIGQDELRLCFSYGNPEDMTEAGRRLAKGIKTLLALNRIRT
jgi:DNA-binding transcriptional MocR family regulator